MYTDLHRDKYGLHILTLDKVTRHLRNGHLIHPITDLLTRLLLSVKVVEAGQHNTNSIMVNRVAMPIRHHIDRTATHHNQVLSLSIMLMAHKVHLGDRRLRKAGFIASPIEVAIQTIGEIITTNQQIVGFLDLVLRTRLPVPIRMPHEVEEAIFRICNGLLAMQIKPVMVQINPHLIDNPLQIRSSGPRWLKRRKTILSDPPKICKSKTKANKILQRNQI